MGHRDVIAAGGDRIRIGPWRGTTDTAAIIPFATNGRLSVEAVAVCLAELHDRGYQAVFTSALAHHEVRPFIESGFELHEELHLLARPLNKAFGRPQRRLRRGRRGDWPRVLDIDGQAFSAFWRFDENGLREAFDATPRHRFRVTRTERVVGYAVAGRAGSNGYLQRVAVDPDAHGQGWGRDLVTDALGWMQRSGATRAYVNTQLDNTVALNLYQRHGFAVEPHRLAVLTRRIGNCAEQTGPN